MLVTSKPAAQLLRNLASAFPPKSCVLGGEVVFKMYSLLFSQLLGKGGKTRGALDLKGKVWDVANPVLSAFHRPSREAGEARPARRTR